ncbi:hypothetical protein VTK26DRAFT_2834 [Humicola hyalothermophila]
MAQPTSRGDWVRDAQDRLRLVSAVLIGELNSASFCKSPRRDVGGLGTNTSGWDTLHTVPRYALLAASTSLYLYSLSDANVDRQQHSVLHGSRFSGFFPLGPHGRSDSTSPDGFYFPMVSQGRRPERIPRPVLGLCWDHRVNDIESVLLFYASPRSSQIDLFLTK